ncbi:hypothetical protein ACFQHO_44830 [Actinomadura yumaensis]|uniref:hypothetical protein n=1 Tax=Actinomadura yumaensis TaxID=111807 RepID=UPI0036207433
MLPLLALLLLLERLERVAAAGAAAEPCPNCCPACCPNRVTSPSRRRSSAATWVWNPRMSGRTGMYADPAWSPPPAMPHPRAWSISRTGQRRVSGAAAAR